MRVSVFGLGYVGCVSAACLARDGHQVIGVDVSADKVAMINDGRSPIVEPGLEPLVTRLIRDGRLSATTDSDAAVRDSDLVCVGTPDVGHGQPDINALSRVATAIGKACANRQTPFTVVVRSTVLPGTNDLLRSRLNAAAAEAMTAPEAAAIRLVSNPEFMREGSSIRDFDHPPFGLIGVDDPDSAALVRSLYASVNAPVVETSIGRPR
jgi:GDP-mannose 6-dehydrogenase